MSQNKKIYLDVCCLNRPYDDWRQERVRWEAEAILAILARIDSGQWQLVSSEAIEAELEKMSNLERLENIFKLLELATITVSLDQNIDQRSQELENLGEGLYDSFHIACAEVERVDVLLTTDDRLLKRATRYRDILQVTLNNPVTWLMDIFQEEGEQNHDTN